MKTFIFFLILTLLGEFNIHAQGIIVITNAGKVIGFAQSSNQKVNNYGRLDGKHKEGKVSQIGDIKIDYYGPAGGRSKEGKISKIGDIKIDYYGVSGGKYKEGKVAKIGDTTVDYYGILDGEYKVGKVKEIKAGHTLVQVAVSLE